MSEDEPERDLTAAEKVLCLFVAWAIISVFSLIFLVVKAAGTADASTSSRPQPCAGDMPSSAWKITR